MNGFATLIALVQEVALGPVGYGIAVWFLAGVFAWSGTAKLCQPTLAAAAMVDFRVVRRVCPALGVLLGATEVLLACALATGFLLRLTVIFAAGLLWIFALLIARSLLAGAHFTCSCFGDADDQLSNLTLARTAALALLASALALVGPPMTSRPNIRAVALQAVAGLSLLGAIVLVSYMPRLLRWNRDFYAVGAPADTGEG
jgi:hypothetical protein